MCIRRFMGGGGGQHPSSVLGKLKTNFVMWGFLPTFLSVSRLLPSWEPALGFVGRFGVGMGLLFSYLSGLRYTVGFFAAYGMKTTQLHSGSPDRVD
jgi:hypothetical protein